MEKKRSFWERTRQVQIALLLASVFLFGFLLGNQYSISSAQGGNLTLPDEARAAFEPLYEAYNLIQQQFIDVPETDELVDGAIRGMVDALDDQHSGYVSPEFYAFVDGDLSGAIDGIGVVIEAIEDTGEIEVSNVLQNTPAEQAGIRVGDIFLTVNDEDVVGLNFLELASRVRGPVGTTVNITMRRGEEILEFDVERARIEIPNVEYEVLDGDIAYIQMQQFSAPAHQQVLEAISELDVNSRSGLILDLRNNSGGLLSSAVNVGALFVEEGVLLREEFGTGETRVFEVRDNTAYEVLDSGDERVYSSDAIYAGVEVPVVVLVNGRSASATELVAGAWQDVGAAIIVGETTFGKGTVQLQNQLVNGGGLRLTIARWLTPNGNWINQQGIVPDVVVEIDEAAPPENGDDPQLDAAIEALMGEITPQIEIERVEQNEPEPVE